MAETPTMKDFVDVMSKMIRESQNEILELVYQNQQQTQEQIVSIAEKIDDMSQRMVTLETRSLTRGSRANSFGSRDGNEETEAKRSAVIFQQESKPSEGDLLGGQLSHLQESETPDGRTSMRSVTRSSGDRRPKNSIYRKNVAMGEDSSDIYTVQPTIKIPLFEHTLRSTQPGAILRFVREWVRYYIKQNMVSK
jgi:hypothetical protein